MCLCMHVLMDVCEIYHTIDLSFVIAYIVIYGIYMLYWTMCEGLLFQFLTRSKHTTTRSLDYMF